MSAPLSISLSPAAFHLPATPAGVAPYKGQIVLTDNSTAPLRVTVSAQSLAGGCAHGAASWIKVQTASLTIKPGVPTPVAFAVAGGASGQAAIIATATTTGAGNGRISGAVGARVDAGTSTAQCAAALPKPAPSAGWPAWAFLLLAVGILVAILALGVAVGRRLRAMGGGA